MIGKLSLRFGKMAIMPRASVFRLFGKNDKEDPVDLHSKKSHLHVHNPEPIKNVASPGMHYPHGHPLHVHTEACGHDHDHHHEEEPTDPLLVTIKEYSEAIKHLNRGDFGKAYVHLKEVKGIIENVKYTKHMGYFKLLQKYK
jgi:hypothetical protein